MNEGISNPPPMYSFNTWALKHKADAKYIKQIKLKEKDLVLLKMEDVFKSLTSGHFYYGRNNVDKMTFNLTSTVLPT